MRVVHFGGQDGEIQVSMWGRSAPLGALLATVWPKENWPRWSLRHVESRPNAVDVVAVTPPVVRRSVPPEPRS